MACACYSGFSWFFLDEGSISAARLHEFVYYFPDEAVLTDHCYWLGPWYWY
mgnify:CR=1 FL=1